MSYNWNVWCLINVSVLQQFFSTQLITILTTWSMTLTLETRKNSMKTETVTTWKDHILSKKQMVQFVLSTTLLDLTVVSMLLWRGLDMLTTPNIMGMDIMVDMMDMVVEPIVVWALHTTVIITKYELFLKIEKWRKVAVIYCFGYVSDLYCTNTIQLLKNLVIVFVNFYYSFRKCWEIINPARAQSDTHVQPTILICSLSQTKMQLSLKFINQ